MVEEEIDQDSSSGKMINIIIMYLDVAYYVMLSLFTLLF